MKMRFIVSLAGAVCAASLLSACGSDTNPAPVTVHDTITMPASTETQVSTQVSTTTVTPSASSTSRSAGTVANADARGFLTGPARCDSGDTARIILRTTAVGKSGSKVVICKSGDSFYYRGARDKAGDAGVTVFRVDRSDGEYRAKTTDGYVYAVSKSGLRIEHNGQTVSDEPAAEFAHAQ